MMKIFHVIFSVSILFVLVSAAHAEQKKTKIFVVNSYHREYLWELEANEGFCAALLDFKFLDNKDQAEEYTRNDYVETGNVIIRKAWMNTKRRNSRLEMEQSAVEILRRIKTFGPDLIILGDDNASNYIGTQYIDSPIPLVFRGIVGTPMKYGLADSIEHPGHNITGVLKLGYPKDTLENFLKLVPQAKTFAVLADNSETSRAKAKEIIQFEDSGKSPLKLVETVLVDSYAEWQDAALRLQDRVDAFFILNHNTLKDENGISVDPFKVTAWYLHSIKIPEMTWEKQFIQEGFLITADDSAFNQGYEAVRMAHMIIHEKKNPADIPCMIPSRGKIIVNRQRAQMLGINLIDKNFIEQYVDKSLALEKYPQ
jgi:ABC-type uncharacterized transport system substrate-binding protein